MFDVFLRSFSESERVGSGVAGFNNLRLGTGPGGAISLIGGTVDFVEIQRFPGNWPVILPE
jgi:hypothetical protein